MGNIPGMRPSAGRAVSAAPVPKARHGKTYGHTCEQPYAAAEPFADKRLRWASGLGSGRGYESPPFGGSDLGHFRGIGQPKDTDLSSRQLAEALGGACGEYVLDSALRALAARAAQDLHGHVGMLGELLRHHGFHHTVRKTLKSSGLPPSPCFVERPNEQRFSDAEVKVVEGAALNARPHQLWVRAQQTIRLPDARTTPRKMHARRCRAGADVKLSSRG